MEVSAIYRKAALGIVVALVCLMIPLVADAQEYDTTGLVVDHPYAVDSCRVLDVADDSQHAGPYWYPVEGDGLERIYSYGCWL